MCALSRTPHILLPYQQKWQADDTQVRIAEKSRRIGFSWNSACEVTLNAARTLGQDAWYVGYNKEMSLEYIRDCTWWARKFNIVASAVEEEIFIDAESDRGILMYTIRFASGWRVSALSSRPTNLRGKKGHIVIDEAAFHDDLRGLLKSAMAVLMWGGQSRVDIMSTHNGVESYYNQLIEETRAGKRPFSIHRVTFMDAIREGFFKRRCIMNGEPWSKEAEAEYIKETYEFYGDDAKEELDCVPARSGGVYFIRSHIERAMRSEFDVLRFEVDHDFGKLPETDRKHRVQAWCEDTLHPQLKKLPQRPHFFGEDFGRKSDLTVLAPGYLTQKLVRRIPFAVELSRMPFEQQKYIVFFLLDRLPMFFAGKFDATGNGSYLAEVAMQRYGERIIEEVHLSAQWYQEHLPKLKAAYDDDEVEQPKDADHLIDLGQFKIIDGQPRLPKTRVKDSQKKTLRHGDMGVAMVLAYAASCMEIADYDYHATKSKPKSTFESVGPSTPRASFRTRRGGIL